MSRDLLRPSWWDDADWESLEVGGMVVESILDQGGGIRPIYASRSGADSHLNPTPPSPSFGFPGTPNERDGAAEISGEDISSFTRNLLAPGFELGPSSMAANLDPPPSLVGDKDLLVEREALNLDASKCRGREEEDPEVFMLNRGLDCGIDLSSPPTLRDCQFRERGESGLKPVSRPPC